MWNYAICSRVREFLQDFPVVASKLRPIVANAFAANGLGGFAVGSHRPSSGLIADQENSYQNHVSYPTVVNGIRVVSVLQVA